MSIGAKPVSSLLDVKGPLAAPDAPSDAPHVLFDFTVEHLVEPPAPLTRAQRMQSTISLIAAITFYAVLFALLFFGAEYTLPQPQQKEPISVDLVQEKKAPPPPPPQVEEKKEQEQKQAQKQKPYEFKGSGDLTKDKAGHLKAHVDADNSKVEPQRKAKKPKPDAPKAPETEIPDWAKSKNQGYELFSDRTSSSTKDAGKKAVQDFYDQVGEGAGDAYLTGAAHKIEAGILVTREMVAQIKRRVVVIIAIDLKGNVRGARLLQSSGSVGFDQAVGRAIANAQPFDPLPFGARDVMEFAYHAGPKD